MRHTILLWFLMLLAITATSQIYDSAIRYKLSPSFSTAMDTLISRAASDLSDTTEGGPTMALTRFKNFMGGRISNDVPAGGDMYAPMSMAI